MSYQTTKYTATTGSNIPTSYGAQNYRPTDFSDNTYKVQTVTSQIF